MLDFRRGYLAYEVNLEEKFRDFEKGGGPSGVNRTDPLM
jgi:hypothetical protein